MLRCVLEIGAYQWWPRLRCRSWSGVELSIGRQNDVTVQLNARWPCCEPGEWTSAARCSAWLTATTDPSARQSDRQNRLRWGILSVLSCLTPA